MSNIDYKISNTNQPKECPYAKEWNHSVLGCQICCPLTPQEVIKIFCTPKR